MAGQDWTEAELLASVEAYFEMLLLDLQGVPFVKREHNRHLRERLDDRNHAAVEFRFRNISWCLAQYDLPVVRGYKPGRGTSNDLVRVVDMYLRKQGFDRLRPWTESLLPPGAPLATEAPPPPTGKTENETRRQARRIDFESLGATRRATGLRAERLVLDAERRRLAEAGAPELAGRVEHVSQTRGDGLGCDILSYDLDGGERFVEVKGTLAGPATPFYLSANELSLAQERPDRFFLHRVHSMAQRPAQFVLDGPTLLSWGREPVSFRVVPA